jgi:hypothetical protein
MKVKSQDESTMKAPVHFFYRSNIQENGGSTRVNPCCASA